MQDKIETVEWLPKFIKIFIPAFLGVGIKIALEMRKSNTKISWLNVGLSFFIGIAGVVILQEPIEHFLTNNELSYLTSSMFAVTAILTDKLAEFAIYRFKIDMFIMAILNNIFRISDKEETK